MFNLYSSEINLNTVGMNLFFLLRKNLKETLIEQKEFSVFNAILVSAICDEEYRKKYAREIDRIRELGRYTTYPSQRISMQIEVKAEVDHKLGLPFINHNGKRLYFPKNYSTKEVEKAYHGYIYGDSFLPREDGGAPHQYQSPRCCVNQGDVIVDVGCAEALFSLDNIDRASKVYLIERDKKWMKALKATFAPYADKVVFVNKLISGSDSRSTITLATLLANETTAPLFVKMDIEGYEVQVVRTAMSFIKSNKNIKLSCCTYHNQHDAEEIEKMFDELQLHHEYSEGYMLFSRYDHPSYPYFRHGLIRAWS